MHVALIVRGRVEEGTEEGNSAPVFVELIRRLAAGLKLRVFSLHGENRTKVLALRRSDEAIHRFAGAEVVQLGTVKTPRLRVLADALRVLAAIRASAARWGPPRVVHGIGMSPGLVAVLLGRWLKVPSVVSLIGGELTDMPEIDYGYVRDAKGRAFAKALLELADTLTVASGFMQKRVRSHGAEARVLPFGIDAARFHAPVSRADGPPFRLLHVGTLSPVKDQLTLVRAFALLLGRGLNVELDIGGFDAWDGAVQRESERLGVGERIRFHGWQSHAELVELSRRAHLFVMTSVDDAAPAVVLEAAAAGLPIVGTDVGYIADWAPHRAVATPVGQPGALADAVAALLAQRELRERMASEAQDWVCRHASVEANDAYLTLYRDLATSAAPIGA